MTTPYSERLDIKDAAKITLRYLHGSEGFRQVRILVTGNWPYRIISLVVEWERRVSCPEIKTYNKPKEETDLISLIGTRIYRSPWSWV